MRVPSPELWDRLRAQVLERASWECESCGASGRRLDVVRVEPTGIAAPANLTALCRPCSFVRHERARRRTLEERELARLADEAADQLGQLDLFGAPRVTFRRRPRRQARTTEPVHPTGLAAGRGLDPGRGLDRQPRSRPPDRRRAPSGPDRRSERERGGAGVPVGSAPARSQ